MSKLQYSDPKTGEPIDFPEAAKKHLEDATILFLGDRYDGAGYLIGYSYECIFKTFLKLHHQIKKTHDLSELSNEALSFAQMGNAKTAKYINALKGIRIQYGNSGWRETLRYQSEGALESNLVDQWITDAENAFNQSIRQMKLDGLI